MSSKLKLIWNRLTGPSPDLLEMDQRRNAQLLSGLLIILTPVGYALAAIPEILSSPRLPLENRAFLIMTLAVVVLAGAYGLSRTRHYRWGVLLALVTGLVAVYAPTFIEYDGTLTTLNYLLVLIIFSGMFMPVLITLGALIVSLVAVLAMPLFIPSITFLQIATGPLALLLIGSGLTVVGAQHRNQLEKDRRAALLIGETRYRTLAEAAPDMIFILDRSGRVQYVNEYGARQVNLRPEDIMGRSREQLFPAEAGGDLQAENVQTVFRTGQPLYLESQPLVVHREIWLGTWLVPLKDEAGQVSAVMGIARNMTAQKRAAQVQDAIYRISEAAQSARHLDDLYRAIHLIIGELMPAENFYIALYDAAADLIIFPYLVDRYEDASPTRPGRGLTSYVLRTGQPTLFTPEIHHQLVERGEISTIGQPSIDWLGAPLKIADRIIGVIAVQTYDSNVRLREADKDILVFVSSQVAMAVERKRAAEAEHEQRALAEALRDTAAGLNSTLNLDEVFDRILSNVGRVVSHDASNIMLIDIEQTHAQIVRAKGYPTLGPTALTLAVFPSLRVPIDLKRPFIVADTHADAQWIDRPESHWIRSHLSVPIRYGGDVIGLLNVDSALPDFFTAAYGEHLQAFADQAAVAIENARLHHALNQYADELEQRVNERTQQLAGANDRLQDLDRLKDQFVSNVSHELRTPIANVKLYLSLLTRGKPEKYDDYLKTLRHETLRLEKLIEDLLDLSRLDLGAAPMNLVPTDVNQVVTRLVADREMLAAEKGLHLEQQLEPNLPLAHADPLRIEQVLANLLANAMNYTLPGGFARLTTARCDAEGQSWIRVTILDTGPGISPNDMPHLFERFYRGAVGRKSGAPGTGLGLAICHEIISRLGGHITVESEPDHGAQFAVWLKPMDSVG